ncbi:MAG: hypothetical protein ACRD4C_01550 [Candidatus Acidiferrales bacterium]
MDAEAPKLDRASAAFALSASITILFNTAIACAKDAYSPLKSFMASLSISDWMTQGLADVILFVLLGLILLNTGLPETISPKHLIAFLFVAVVIAGVGLFAWYALY